MNFLLIFLFSFLISQEVFDGYVLYTPGGGGASATTYLKDTDGTIINSWSLQEDPVCLRQFQDEPGFENTIILPPQLAIQLCKMEVLEVK